MARIQGIPTIDCKITLVMDEAEARALLQIAAYGDDAFIQHFGDKLGDLTRYEPGLRKLLKDIRCNSGIGSVLGRLDDARRVWDESAKATAAGPKV